MLRTSITRAAPGQFAAISLGRVSKAFSKKKRNTKEKRGNGGDSEAPVDPGTPAVEECDIAVCAKCDQILAPGTRAHAASFRWYSEDLRANGPDCSKLARY